MKEPGALTSMLAWYRALRYQNPEMIERLKRITVPTLSMGRVFRNAIFLFMLSLSVIWGVLDTALDVQLAHESLTYCTNGKLFLIDDAGHFVPNEKPTVVSEQIYQFISAA